MQTKKKRKKKKKGSGQKNNDKKNEDSSYPKLYDIDPDELVKIINGKPEKKLKKHGGSMRFDLAAETKKD